MAQEVISSRMLSKIATIKPQSEEALLDVMGLDTMMELFGIEKDVILRFLPVVQSFCQDNGIVKAKSSSNEPPPLADGVKLKEVLNCPKCFHDKITNTKMQASHRFLSGESIEMIATTGRRKPCRKTTIIDYIATTAMDQPLNSGLADKLINTLNVDNFWPWTKESEMKFFAAIQRMTKADLDLLKEVRKHCAAALKKDITEVDYGEMKIYLFKFFYMRGKGQTEEYLKQSRLKRRSSHVSEGPSPKRLKPNPGSPFVPPTPNVTPVNVLKATKPSSPAKFTKPTSPVSFKKSQSPTVKKKSTPLFGKKRTSFSFGSKKKPSFGGNSANKKKPSLGGNTSATKKKPTFGSFKKPSASPIGKKRKSTPVFGSKAKKSPNVKKKPSPFGSSKI